MTAQHCDLPALRDRMAAAQLALCGNIESLAESTTRLREAVESLRVGRSEREILHDVAYARLVARLNSMPVIEQAKGIIMAESRCTAEEAFGMLRAASQRSNVKLRDLAEQIVSRVAGDSPPQSSAEPSDALNTPAT